MIEITGKTRHNVHIGLRVNGEDHDVAAQHPEVVARLREEL